LTQTFDISPFNLKAFLYPDNMLTIEDIRALSEVNPEFVPVSHLPPPPFKLFYFILCISACISACDSRD
jgi:hypothetical protein